MNKMNHVKCINFQLSSQTFDRLNGYQEKLIRNKYWKRNIAMKMKDLTRFEDEDIYFLHKIQKRAFVRLKGEDEIYYAKFPGEDPMRIPVFSKSVTDAWIFGTEITKEEYARF